MIFIKNLMNVLTIFNTYCINDPLLIPMYFNEKLGYSSYLSEISDKNSFVICDNINSGIIEKITKKIDRIFEIELKTSESKLNKLKKTRSKKYQENDEANNSKDLQKLDSLKIVEITAFLSSLFAFGSRISIMNFLINLFEFYSPFKLIEKNLKEDLKFNDIQDNIPYYRWINKKLVYLLLVSLNIFYKRYDSIYHYCTKYLKEHKDSSYLKSMIDFSKSLMSIIEENSRELNIGLEKKELLLLKNLLPSSLVSSSAKRYNLFLKWMIRKNYPDLGLWSRLNNELFHQDNIFFPLDVHILQLTSILILFMIEDFYLNFYPDNYPLNSSSSFSETFSIFKSRLYNLLKEKKLLEIINEMEKRYILKDNFSNYLNYILSLKIESNDKNYPFISYLQKYNKFFKNSFKRKSMFSNKSEHLEIITDFYRIFNKSDPLIFDLPLSIMRSPILKSKK